MPHLKSAVGQEINVNDVVRRLSQHLSESENTVDISIQVVIVSLKCNLVLKYRLKHNHKCYKACKNSFKFLLFFFYLSTKWLFREPDWQIVNCRSIVREPTFQKPTSATPGEQRTVVPRQQISHQTCRGCWESEHLQKNNNKCKWSAWEQILFTITSTAWTLPSCVDMVMSNVGTGVTGEEP